MLCQTVSHVHVLRMCVVTVCQTDLLFCSLRSPVSHMWPLHTQISLSCSSPSRWASPNTNSFTSYLPPTHICLYGYYHLTSSSYTLNFFSTDVVLSPLSSILLCFQLHLPSDSLALSPLLAHPPTTAALGPSSGEGPCQEICQGG